MRPAGIVTDVGTGKAELLDDSDTTAPEDGAATFRSTMTYALCPAVIEDGVIVTVVNVAVGAATIVALPTFDTPLYVAVTETGVDAVTADV